MAALWERLDPPEAVATAQRAWDRNALVYRMRQAGYTLAAIGGQIGMSPERVRQREAKFYRTRGKPSPIERWLHDWRDDLAGEATGPKPFLLDERELLRRALDVARRAEKAREQAERDAEHDRRWREAEVARIAERRREILGETEKDDEAAVAEARASVVEDKVTAKDVLLCNAAMAVLGHFEGDEEDPKTQGQLHGYWRAISRGVENILSIPVCFYRFNAVLAFAYENAAFCELIGAQRAEDHIGLPALDDEFCAVVAAMPVRWANETDKHFRLTPIRCEPDGTMKLARLYFEIGGNA